MWNPDHNEKKKNFLSNHRSGSEEVLATAPIQQRVDIMGEYEIFKYNFLNSSLVRTAHGFEKQKDGKLLLVDRSWVDTTVDETKKQWVREIYKEINGVQDVGKDEQVRSEEDKA